MSHSTPFDKNFGMKRTLEPKYISSILDEKSAVSPSCRQDTKQGEDSSDGSGLEDRAVRAVKRQLASVERLYSAKGEPSQRHCSCGYGEKRHNKNMGSKRIKFGKRACFERLTKRT